MELLLVPKLELHCNTSLEDGMCFVLFQGVGMLLLLAACE